MWEQHSVELEVQTINDCMYGWTLRFNLSTEEKLTVVKIYVLNLHTHISRVPSYQLKRVCSSCLLAELAHERCGVMAHNYYLTRKRIFTRLDWEFVLHTVCKASVRYRF